MAQENQNLAQQQGPSAAEKLQVAMGLKPDTAGVNVGLSQGYLGKWRMFLRGKSNDLLGVEILSDYLDKRQKDNGGTLPGKFDIIGDKPERKALVGFLDEKTVEGSEDKDAYLEAFTNLGVDINARIFPIEFAKGLDFFGRIFADLGMADCEDSERAGIFMSAENQREELFKGALGEEGRRVWEQGEAEVAKLAQINAPKVELGTEGLSEMGDFEEWESFGEETPEAQTGKISVQENTTTESEINLEDKEEEETTEEIKQSTPVEKEDQAPETNQEPEVSTNVPEEETPAQTGEVSTTTPTEEKPQNLATTKFAFGEEIPKDFSLRMHSTGQAEPYEQNTRFQRAKGLDTRSMLPSKSTLRLRMPLDQAYNRPQLNMSGMPKTLGGNSGNQKDQITQVDMTNTSMGQTDANVGVTSDTPGVSQEQSKKKSKFVRNYLLVSGTVIGLTGLAGSNNTTNTEPPITFLINLTSALKVGFISIFHNLF